MKVTDFEYLFSPGGQNDQCLRCLPGHGGRVEVDVIDDIVPGGSYFRSQSLVHIAAFYVYGFDVFEIVFPDIVISYVSQKEMINGFGLYQCVGLNVVVFAFIEILLYESLDFKVPDIISEQA